MARNCLAETSIKLNMDEAGTTDWGAWSRQAVRLMQERNAVWQQRFGLASGCPFHWDLGMATIEFRRTTDEVVAGVCVVGTTSVHENTFLWGWADENIPPAARKRLEQVREFGAKHNLDLLTTPQFPGGRPEALEMAAVTGRVLDAEGVFSDSVDDDLTVFFVLSGFHVRTR
jgi:hypothetical protein